MIARYRHAAWLVAGFASCAVSAVSADDDDVNAVPNSYSATRLVTDGFTSAPHIDANLQNPWGIAFNPLGDVWVSDNGSSKSTLYDGEGNPNSLIVNIPAGVAGDGSPTGIVYNASSDFVVSNDSGASGPAIFIFAGEHGTISGWSPDVDRTTRSSRPRRRGRGAIYKGIALAGNGTEEPHLRDRFPQPLGLTSRLTSKRWR